MASSRIRRGRDVFAWPDTGAMEWKRVGTRATGPIVYD